MDSKNLYIVAGGASLAISIAFYFGIGVEANPDARHLHRPLGPGDPVARQSPGQEGQVNDPFVFALGVIVMIPVLFAAYKDLKS